MSQNAQSVFTRQQPKPRMRQQRNNSVAPAPEAPADTADEAQLSIVPDEDEPTFDAFVTDLDPEAAAFSPGQHSPPTEAKDEQAAPADTQAEDKPAPATAEDKPVKSTGQDKPDTGTPDAATAVPEPTEPATEDSTGPAAGDEPAQPAAEPTPAPVAAPAKKSTKSTAKSPATKRRGTAAAADKAGGTALAVINPDGSVTVDPGTHLVDLRDVASQDDPHALVDMLAALREVSDSDLRQRVTSEISEAITTAALRG